MDTGGNPNTGTEAKILSWRRIYLPLGALLLSALLLSAWVSALAADPPPESPAPNADPAAPDAIFDFDCEIRKTQSGALFIVGANNQYKIDVGCTISETASAPGVIDELPNGVTPSEISAEDWTCSHTSATNIVSCYYKYSLSKNDQAGPPETKSLPPIFITVDIPPDTDEYITNDVELTDEDNDPSNNTDSVTAQVDSVDLEIVKSQEPSVVEESENLTYTLVITNHGPATAQNVLVLDDTLEPDYLTYSTPTEDAGSSILVGDTLTWTITSLAKDATAKLTLPATTKPGSSGEVIENTATVTSTNLSDWDQSNNSDSATLIIGGLEISKRVSSSPPYYVGQPITFTLAVTNVSSVSAYYVRVTDTFTPGLDIEKCYLDTTAFSCSRNLNKYIGTMSANQTRVIRVRTRANDTVDEEVPTTIKNTAKVSWASPTVSRTSNEVELVVEPAADLEVTKTGGPSEVNRNQTIEYKIEVENFGNLPATNVVVSDTLSQYLSFVEVITSGLEMTETKDDPIWPLYAWEIGHLDPGEYVYFKIKTKVASNTPEGTLVYNEAEAVTDEEEHYFDNNVDRSDESEVVLEPIHKIGISYYVDPTTAAVDDVIVFTVKVVNSGSEEVTGIEVTDSYPSILNLSSATTDKGTVNTNSSTREWVWKIGTLDEDKEARLKVETKVNSAVKEPETYKTWADMIYDDDNEKDSNTVTFRIVPASTLPGTGGMGILAAGSGVFPTLALAVALLLGILGLAALGYCLWARARRPLWVAWYARAGLILLAGALVFGAVGWLSRGTGGEGEQLAALSGEKPPLASKLPTQVLPSEIPTEAVAQEVIQWDPTSTPDSLPDYPIPTPTVTITAGPDGELPDTSPVTRIIIPILGVDTVVKFVPYSGSTWLIGGLKQEVAWMGETSWPGLGSNTGLAGHVDLVDGSEGPFWRLGELKPGDEVILYTEKNIYTYKVRDQVVVDDYDTSVIEPTEDPQITLITCTEWDAALRVYLKRLVVFSDLETIKPLNQ